MLVPPIFAGYLSREERQAIEDAFPAEYDRDLRGRLLDGLTRDFVKNFLVTKADPGTQLFFDLKILNEVERLSDGSTPFAQWLANALRRFGAVANLRTLLEGALERVTNRQPAVAQIDKKDVCILNESEEVITDGIDDILDVSFLTIGASRIAGVAKLVVPCWVDDTPVMLKAGEQDMGSGTAWLIASDLLMTNYHVVRLRPTGVEPRAADLERQVTGATAFFFQDENEHAGTGIKVKRLIASGRTRETDYALLQLAEKPTCKFLPISQKEVHMPEPVLTAKGKAVKLFVVNIIQHPLGGPKRVALRNNKVYDVSYPSIFYFTDTLEGSSGAPVFDDHWRVIALHRASVKERTEYNGKKDVGYVNHGIQLHAILADLDKAAQSDATVSKFLNDIRKERKEQFPEGSDA